MVKPEFKGKRSKYAAKIWLEFIAVWSLNLPMKIEVSD